MTSGPGPLLKMSCVYLNSLPVDVWAIENRSTGMMLRRSGASGTAGSAVAVNAVTVTFPPFTVTFRLTGVNVKPAFVGATVYVPLPRPGKL